VVRELEIILSTFLMVKKYLMTIENVAQNFFTTLQTRKADGKRKLKGVRCRCHWMGNQKLARLMCGRREDVALVSTSKVPAVANCGANPN